MDMIPLNVPSTVRSAAFATDAPKRSGSIDGATLYLCYFENLSFCCSHDLLCSCPLIFAVQYSPPEFRVH